MEFLYNQKMIYKWWTTPHEVMLRANPPVRPHNFLGILKDYKFPPPLNFIFNWEDQQGY